MWLAIARVGAAPAFCMSFLDFNTCWTWTFKWFVGAAEGWGGWRGHDNPCAVLGFAVLCYGVGVGVVVMRIIGRHFVAFLARA